MECSLYSAFPPTLSSTVRPPSAPAPKWRSVGTPPRPLTSPVTSRVRLSLKLLYLRTSLPGPSHLDVWTLTLTSLFEPAPTWTFYLVIRGTYAEGRYVSGAKRLSTLLVSFRSRTFGIINVVLPPLRPRSLQLLPRRLSCGGEGVPVSLHLYVPLPVFPLPNPSCGGGRLPLRSYDPKGDLPPS